MLRPESWTYLGLIDLRKIWRCVEMDLWDKCTRTRRGYLEVTGAFDFPIAVGRHRHPRVERGLAAEIDGVSRRTGGVHECRHRRGGWAQPVGLGADTRSHRSPPRHATPPLQELRCRSRDRCTLTLTKKTGH